LGLKWGYDALRTLVALPDPATRRTLRKTLQAEGLMHCREVAEMPALADHLARGEPDLLIVALDEQNWDSSGLIREIRQGTIGKNPFMMVIVLLQTPSPVLVTRAVDAGTDDLLLAPWLGRLVLDRLDNFVQGRKPFLITHDYIGPERRAFYREGSPTPQTVQVPNPVQWLSAGNDDRAAYRKQVTQALEAVNLNKIKSCGGQLRFLADRTVEVFSQSGHAAIVPIVRALLDSADEMARRAANTDFAPAIELTASLRGLCQRLLREERAPRPDVVAVLPVLAEAVFSAMYWHEKDALPAV